MRLATRLGHIASATTRSPGRNPIMKRWAIGILAATLSLQALAQGDLGVVELRQSDSRLFSIQQPAPGQNISVVSADGTVRCCYRIGKPDRQNHLQQIDQPPADAATVAYRLTPSSPGARMDLPMIGIAFPATPALVVTARSADETLFRWQGSTYRLKQCTTMEGVQLTLRQQGNAERQYYFSLGYDTEPTCKP